MPDQSRWESWSPAWAPHVEGRYTTREVDPETCMLEPQKVEMRCNHCNVTWQTTCASGAPRRHIALFAKQHTHRDFADVPKVVRPGSKRASIVER